MAEFVWEARARTGEVRKGAMEAESEDAVNQRLRAQQLQPTKVKKKSREGGFQIGTGVSSKDIVTFTRLFATMIDAGLPIVQCLDILQGQTDNKLFANVLRDVKASVEQGATFSDSLRRHPKVFDHLYVNLVQAGEVGGILDTILNRLAVYIEKAMKLKRQVRGAMVYPASSSSSSSASSRSCSSSSSPASRRCSRTSAPRTSSPLSRRSSWRSRGASSGTSSGCSSPSSGLLTAFNYYYRTVNGKRRVHKLMLMAPVLGPVLRKIAVARFTRTLGTLLASGVPILDALEIVAKTAGNVVVEEAIMYARAKISEGKNMAEPLLQTDVFPPMVVQMVGVGEQTGALDTMLNKIADFYEDEVDVAVSAMTSLIEPVMMVGVGGTVGVVLIAMYLPIFSIAGKIKAE